ncbi:NAD(P)-dependent dehydrogenase (short-subunit alcohol dehydrogenase family) [Bradyrhizobium elkanii]|uniref:Oxidoreductase n=1 Tax=Bradyrhizobium japonicum TaxID=375 RepID=A0A1L3FL75_BRAJP|nr:MULTISPECIES: SDR family oxidoreductase [Bradyrhizobium]APG14056.1 oxidoreductase [Bradyrhizobium japonicum]MCS3932302.1 NAD(P)-dependent dehydrogenase (short-subunit alcohol dehydrogenase family) [Bradyrhizobium elkanii]MCS3972860.1 NAD(P)-dependent dehydrogenase (short-subunit alcohol dehydrogenase family) [Bradyrhizobium japonicum]
MDKRPHALVTGASSGIGAAIVERLLRDGWRVTGISRRPAPFDHPAFDHLSLDLGEVDNIANAVAGIAPTALVHAAGMLKVGELGSLDHDDGTAMWRLHVDVAARLANALAPRLPKGGRIIFIGSRTASGAAGRGQYAATKAALVALARSWAIELAPRGVTVNVVAPAATETPMLKDPTRADVAPKLPPIGRFIRPEEVAHAVAFLLSPEAAAITGQQLVICGGSSL